MADEEDIAALVIDNGSGMCKGALSSRVVGKIEDVILQSLLVCLSKLSTKLSRDSITWCRIFAKLFSL